MTRRYLTPVPKPADQELASRRGAESGDPSTWLPQHALYDAHTDMQAGGVDRAMVLAWYEPNEEGRIRLRWRAYGATVNDTIALIAQLAREMAKP